MARYGYLEATDGQLEKKTLPQRKITRPRLARWCVSSNWSDYKGFGRGALVPLDESYICRSNQIKASILFSYHYKNGCSRPEPIVIPRFASSDMSMVSSSSAISMGSGARCFIGSSISLKSMLPVTLALLGLEVFLSDTEGRYVFFAGSIRLNCSATRRDQVGKFLEGLWDDSSALMISCDARRSVSYCANTIPFYILFA